jgi:hypothetical protein
LYDLLAGFTRPVNAVQQRLTAQLNRAVATPASGAGDEVLETRGGGWKPGE